MTDHHLLKAYAAQGPFSEVAFAEIVARHLNLVYSAAHRQVPPLADDITQSVFRDLARRARDFPVEQPLAPWLHTVTRRTAVDLIRRESRRATRETTAAQIAATDAMHPSSPSPWSAIAPHLDEAVDALPAADRAVIILRFFESKNFRDIGATIGLSDDAAQKRVSRALDRLRTALTRRGLTVTAAGLATDLSAHAILTAPACLVGAVKKLAATTLTTGLTNTAETVVLTTLQKSLFTAALVVLAGTGLYVAQNVSSHRDELSQIEYRSFTLTADLARARREHVATSQRLASVESQIDANLTAARAMAAPPATDPALEKRLRSWLANLDYFKQLLSLRPDLSIPELQLLSPDDWSSFAFSTPSAAELDTDAGFRSVSSSLRQKAENLMALKLHTALKAYIKASNEKLPASLDQLLPYFVPAITPELLNRYELLSSATLSALPGRDNFNAIIKTQSVVDRERDLIWLIGIDGVIPQPARAP